MSRNTYLDAETFDKWVELTRLEFGRETAEVFKLDASGVLEIEFITDLPCESCSGSFALITQEEGSFVEGGFSTLSELLEFVTRMGWNLDPDSKARWEKEICKYQLQGRVRAWSISSV